MPKSLFSAFLLVMLCYLSLSTIENNYTPKELTILSKGLQGNAIIIPRESRDTITSIPIVGGFDRFTCATGAFMTY
jgi:hypothetical protein